jgi:hypothetical protein
MPNQTMTVSRASLRMTVAQARHIVIVAHATASGSNPAKKIVIEATHRIALSGAKHRMTVAHVRHRMTVAHVRHRIT